MLTVTTAYLYGANVIEKHFTLDKELAGNDHYHAMDPTDLEKFTHNINLLQKINGQYYKQPLECEQESRKQARRSIVATVNMEKGEFITRNKVTFKRPGTGISPADLDKVIGRKVTEKIEKDSILTYEKI
jgi:N-acetylneuraminate synthase